MNVRVLDDNELRAISQQDPVPNMVALYAEDAQSAKRHIADLTRLLRQLDEGRDKLAEHGITVDVDLGPIGDAAAACRRDLAKQRGPEFRLPTGDTA
jgi:hypothetical protein